MTKTHYAYIIFCAILGLGIASMVTGCDIGDIITVKTPPSIQTTLGMPPKMTLNESEVAYRNAHEDMARDLADWKAEISEKAEWRATLNTIGLQAFDEYGAPALAGVLPGGLGIIGLVLGQLGLRRHKEESYAKGRKDAIADVAAGKEIAKG